MILYDNNINMLILILMLSFMVHRTHSISHFIWSPIRVCEVRVHIVNGGQGHRAGKCKSQDSGFWLPGGEYGAVGVCPSVSVHQPEGGPPRMPCCPALWRGSGGPINTILFRRPLEVPDATPHPAGCLAGRAQDLFSASLELQCEPVSPLRPCGP